MFMVFTSSNVDFESISARQFNLQTLGYFRASWLHDYDVSSPI
jgi:hypothetical protein